MQCEQVSIERDCPETRTELEIKTTWLTHSSRRNYLFSQSICAVPAALVDEWSGQSNVESKPNKQHNQYVCAIKLLGKKYKTTYSPVILKSLVGNVVDNHFNCRMKTALIPRKVTSIVTTK